MNIVSGKTTTLSKNLLAHAASYRQKVFIETLGWELDSTNGEELDQFDRDDTVYVIAQDEQGRINGCARLLPRVCCRPIALICWARSFPS